MKRNLPVSQHEYTFDKYATLLSTTDLKGRITYANSTFMQVSGYSYSDLMGKAHNLVRHPDVPSQIFQDLWNTLHSGHSWTGVVKNRRANGDHYWVRANVTPVVSHGQTVGYLSVRTQPTEAEKISAQALYQQVSTNKSAYRFYHGLALKTGLLAWLSWLQTMSVQTRLNLGSLIFIIFFAITALLSGLSGAPLIALSIAMGCATLCTTLWLNRQIVRPLRQIMKQAAGIATGRLESVMPMNRCDDIGLLLRAINQSGLNLKSLSDDVGTQLYNLQDTSQEVSQGGISLGTQSKHAASSLRQTLSSLHAMTNAVQHNTHTAQQASALATLASTAAAHGSEVVSQVMDAMTDISTSSAKINDIVTTIDSIAFQTNILALNAAVEAARAGEEGKGFAVVAHEVRTLALRSASAAQEIKRVVQDTLGTISAGSERATEADSAMLDIVKQVSRVTDLIADISAASTEQSADITQISQAVAELNTMTDSNATMAVQSANSAKNIQDQATQLSHAIGAFGNTLATKNHGHAPVLITPPRLKPIAA